MHGILSSIGCNMLHSWALAGVSSTASGTPLPSTIRCCFVPSFPRSVGFGPVSWPPLLLAHSTHRAPLATSRSDRLLQARRAEPGAVAPTRPLSANRVAAASTSCRNRTPSPAASTPTRSPSGARTGSQSAPRDCRMGAYPRAASAGREGGEVRFVPTARPIQGALPWTTHLSIHPPVGQVLLGSLSIQNTPPMRTTILALALFVTTLAPSLAKEAHAGSGA